MRMRCVRDVVCDVLYVRASERRGERRINCVSPDVVPGLDSKVCL